MATEQAATRRNELLLGDFHRSLTGTLAGAAVLGRLAEPDLLDMYWAGVETAVALADKENCSACDSLGRLGADHELCQRAFYITTGALVAQIDYQDPDAKPKRSLALWAQACVMLQQAGADPEKVATWFNFGGVQQDVAVQLMHPQVVIPVLELDSEV